jgi:hypothetical protein
MEHRAPMKLLHLFLCFAKALTFLQVFPISVISSCVVLLQVFLGRPLLLVPWGFQSNTSFSIAPAGFLKVCPIHLHFLFLIWMSIGSCFVISHRELFHIVPGHLMFKICLGHHFISLLSSTHSFRTRAPCDLKTTQNLAGVICGWNWDDN